MALIRCEFINASSCGIVVWSTLIPATFVCVGLAARPAGATAPAAPSERPSTAMRTSKRRNRLLIGCLPLFECGYRWDRGLGADDPGADSINARSAADEPTSSLRRSRCAGRARQPCRQLRTPRFSRAFGPAEEQLDFEARGEDLWRAGAFLHVAGEWRRG